MLSEAENHILENLGAFIVAGGNTMLLTRRDALHLVAALNRLARSEAPRQVAKPSSGCARCGQAFTTDNPARVMVSGKGQYHASCADLEGITWRPAKR